MRDGNRQSRIRRGSLGLAALAGLLAAGCSGLRTHRPQDLATVQAAQTQFEAADLTSTVVAERQRLDEVLAEELELIRQHTLARRDARLLYIIGEGDSTIAWKFLADDIHQRVRELGFDDRSFADTLAKIAQLPTAEAALGQSISEWEVLRAADPDLPALSCPLPRDFEPESLPRRARIRFEDYQFYCESYLAVSDIPSRNGARIAELREARAEVEAATSQALDALGQARSEYAAALESAGPDEQARKRQLVLATFRDLGDLGHQLQAVRDAETSLAPMGLGQAAADLVATVDKARLEVERGNVIAALAAAVDNQEAQKWLFPRLDNPRAAGFVDALADIGSTLDATEAPGPVTSLLVRQEQLDLDIRQAEKRQDFFDRLIELLAEQDKAFRVEVVHLGQAMRLLTDLENSGCLAAEGPAGDGIAQLLTTGTEEKCREKIFRLLVAYSSSWTLGRAVGEQIDQRLIGLHQQAALDASEIAFAKWQSLLGLPIDQLVALYQTGIKAQDFLDLLDILGLGAIAAGVN